MIKSAIYALLTILAVIGIVLGLTFFEWFRILTLVSMLGVVLFAVWLFLFDEFEAKRIAKQSEPKIVFSVDPKIAEMDRQIAILKSEVDKMGRAFKR